MRRLARALLHLYPRAFRRRFGQEMVQQVEHDLERARRRGRWAALLEMAWATWDLLAGAMAERVSPTWVDDGRRHDDEGDVMTTMGEALRDLRRAARSLARRPGFTAVAVGTLALAIGVNAALFSMMDTVLLRPLPYEDPDDLVYIAASAPGTDFPSEFGVSWSFFHQYREAEALEGVAVWNDFTNTARLDDRVERVVMVASPWTLFETLDVAPALGRLPAEDPTNPVVVLSHAMWTSWFGADPDVIGRTLFASGQDRTIVAVMGPDFFFPYDGVQLWLPAITEIQDEGEPRFGQGMVARLAPGADIATLTPELGRLASRIPERFGWSASNARVMERHVPVVRPLRTEVLGDLSGPLWVLLGSTVIVLLIACANVANLFLVRAEHRRRDMSVHAALGASRGRRIRVLLSEAMVVAGLAGLLSMALARAGLPMLVQAAPDSLPRLADVDITGGALVFAGLLTGLAALICGLGPALRGSRADMTRLRSGSRGSTGGGRAWRDVLVAGQTALALVLLVASGLLARSFLAVSDVDPGYDTSDLLTFQIAPEAEELTDGPSFARFHLDFSERLAALPGVQSTGIVENVPLDEGLSNGRFVPAEAAIESEAAPLLNFTFSDARYFETMGIDLLAGRTFSPAEVTDGLRAAILSQEAAELLWPSADPIGRQFRSETGETVYTVVGVVEDILQYDLRNEPQPLIYFPLVGPTPTSWIMASPGHVVRSSRADALVPEVRALVRELAPQAPMYRVYTMADLTEDNMQTLTSTLLILGITSVLALVLGMVGLFGVLSYAVARRTQEIGVRMALGADAGRVQALVVAQAARVVGVGIALGLAVAWLSTGVLGSLLFQVEPWDPVTFSAVSVLLAGVATLACWLPARRASHVHPTEALREG